MSKELREAIVGAENDYHELKDLMNLVFLLVECNEIIGTSPDGTASITRLLSLIDDRARGLLKGWTLMHELVMKEGAA